ncbi:MAG TPA: hypothetical protein VJV78_02750 [Polyangiales bacterium]|nr:hypothetical protein [Polyangiales bacterium]
MRIRFCVSLGLYALAACGENAAARSAQAQHEREAALARDPELQDPLGRALLEQVAKHAPGWVKHEQLRRGTLNERARQGFLVVLPYGHCYRFIASGGPGVSDLDLALFDGNGVEISRDTSEDPSPNLGVVASICPSDASAVRIEARMRRGHGDFALGVFQSPD